MFDFNMTSNPCSYLAIFVPKTLSVVYNGLNSIKSPQLFHFIWVKIHSYIHLCPLPNYLLQTPQIYSDFTQSFPLSVMSIRTLTIFFSFILFYFILFYFIFSDFTFLFLYCIGKTMKKTRDKEVTWQVTWCDIIGLEPGGRI